MEKWANVTTRRARSSSGALARLWRVNAPIVLQRCRDATFARAAADWVITINDNLDALRFYQRRGMRLVAVRPGAVDEARRLKPSIPVIGAQGIPIHDELELELRLDRPENLQPGY